MLDFSNEPPRVTCGPPVGQSNGNEGSANFTDPNTGKLRLYTDGITVFNGQSNQALSNGTGLKGNPSATEAAMIVPVPGTNQDLFYIFTNITENSYSGQVYYSIADLSQGTDGTITVKNQLLASNTSEALGIVPHSNGKDFWVLVFNTPAKIDAYLVNESGIGSNAVSSNTGFSTGGALGAIIHSPDYNTLALSQASTRIATATIDRSTGNISNLTAKVTGNVGYSMTFSPDGTKLYYSGGGSYGTGNPWQIDLTTGATTQLNSASGFGGPKVAPNGKIYWTGYGKTALSVVNNPNAAGAAANFALDALSLNGCTGSWNLPNQTAAALRQLNRQPVVVNRIPDQTATEGQSFSFTIPDNTFSDPDGDALTLSISGLPSGLSFDSNTGKISGIPAEGTGNQTYEVTLTADDGNGGTVSTSFNLTVNPATVQPEPCECEAANGVIEGIKWDDRNGNGKQDGEIIQGDPPDAIFLIDVSGSTDKPFEGETEIGDVNADGEANTILDAEIAAFTGLNRQIINQGFGEIGRVGIVVFGTRSAQVDLQPFKDGKQLVLAPNTDDNDNGIPDIQEVLQTIQEKSNGVGGYTNFEAALQDVEVILQDIGTERGNGNVILLSDGKPTRGGSYTDEVERLKAAKVKLTAFGVGNGASLEDLKKIDPQAEIFTNTDDIVDVFSGLKPRKRIIDSDSNLEPGLGDFVIYLDLNNNGKRDFDEPTRITVANGRYRFSNLSPGTYIVREVQKEGFEQTAPSEGFATVKLTVDKQTATVNFGNKSISAPKSDKIKIVNVNAVKNYSQETAAVITVPAGIYRVSIIDTAAGGEFDAWSSYDKNIDCKADGTSCKYGWGHEYSIRPGSDFIKVDGTGEYATPEQALSNAPNDVSFTLEEESEVQFYLYNPSSPDNNRGGVSLKVEKLD